MRHIRHRVASAAGRFNPSPQRMHTGPLRTEKSAQHTSQIETEESRGRGVPHKAQEAGSRAQLIVSRGLRSTRTTARHFVVSDGGTSPGLALQFVWKTHLAWRQGRHRAARCAQYSALAIRRSTCQASAISPSPAKKRTGSVSAARSGYRLSNVSSCRRASSAPPSNYGWL
jgi:hypothetical protein